MRERVHVREVGPRDGIQMVQTLLSTEHRRGAGGRPRRASRRSR
jgi:hypothetical protein